jgi:DNA polymerase III sliding clamp (beta) subunit (PCNA family)
VKPPKTLIEKAATTEESRYSLQGVLYDVEHKCLVATDGHILAVVPHEPENGDAKKIIPLKAFQAMRKRGSKEKPVVVSQEERGVMVKHDGEERTFIYPSGQFPNYRPLLPKKDDKYDFVVALDIRLLVRLAAALTEKGAPNDSLLKLYVKKADQAVLVRPSGAPDEVMGLIMPIRA